MHKRLALASVITSLLTACGGEEGTINTKPYIDAIPNLVVGQGQDFTYKVKATDSEIITYQLVGNPVWVSIDENTGLITVDSTESVVGIYTFTVIVSDGELSTSSVIQLEVTQYDDNGQNNAPEIAAIPKLKARTHYPLNYRVLATDINGDFLSYTLNGHPEWVSIDIETGWLKVEALNEDEGDYEFEVIVNDGITSTSASIELIVEAAAPPVEPEFDNHLPIVQPIPELTVSTDKTLSHRVMAYDADGQVLTYSIQENPTWIRLDPEKGLLKVTPSESNVGKHSFNIVVSDGLVEVIQTLKVTVTESTAPEIPNVETAPMVTDIPALNVRADHEVSYRVKAFDADKDILTYSLNSGSDWVRINPETGLIIAKPTAAVIGTHAFAVTVTDGVFDVVKPFSIVVADSIIPEKPDNSAPVVETIPTLNVKTGQQLSYRVSATDADGDTLTYDVEAKPVWMTVNPRIGVIVVDPPAGQGGTYNFDLQVSDAETTTVAPFTLNVTEQILENHPPVIEMISDITATSGKEMVYRVKANDINGDKLGYSLQFAPTWVTIDGESGIMLITPPSDVEGTHEFFIDVTDGKVVSSQTVKLNVFAPTTPCSDGSCLDDDFGHPETPALTPVTYNATLTSNGKVIKGDVICEGDSLEDGKFITKESDSVTCSLGSVTLGYFEPKRYPINPEIERPETADQTYDLIEIQHANVTPVLQAISTCSTSTVDICLDSIDSIEIADIYTQLDNDEAVHAFLESKGEEATDEIGKAPSSHEDPSLVPVVTPGSSNDLNGGFISANAEESLSYTPSVESKVLTTGLLKDNEGRAIVGLQYFSSGQSGFTSETGEFEFLWGDEIRFGIDTFDLGAVKGNKLEFVITDVTNNPVEKSNIESLFTRYMTTTDSSVLVTDKVKTVFANYPNVINETINLALPNGGKLAGTEFVLPNEFEKQFEHGVAQVIDERLKQPENTFVRNSHLYSSPSDESYVTDSLNAIFARVESFHVFGDTYGYYGAMGKPRGMRAINVSNRAFPVMMPRNDINFRVPFGERQAWTRDGKPYIADHETIEMQPIPIVDGDNVTYNLPFVLSGEIGSGKVVYMGNSFYPSILSCPENYWANGWEVTPNATTKLCDSGVAEDDARSDNGDMQRYFVNLFNWFSPGATNVATNIETAQFVNSNAHSGRVYDFFISENFGFDSVTKVDSGSYGALNPIDTPILILQAYGITEGAEYNVANVSDPKLSVEDVTDLINYINAGGNVLFMDGIEASNPEPIGRLADAAGMSLGGDNVVPTQQSHCGTSTYCSPASPNLSAKGTYQTVLLQRFDDLSAGNPPFTVNTDGTVTWAPDEDMLDTPFHIPKYEKIGDNGEVQEVFAHHSVRNETERDTAIAELQNAFPGTPLCTSDYEYEFNCIEVREGHGQAVRGPFGRPDFVRLSVDVPSMVKAANLGQNVQMLADHEMYYRTKGAKGKRLSTVELNQTYDNLSVWLWNDNQYEYDNTVQDELGFETIVSYLNCYTDNKHGGNLTCPETLRSTLVENGMIYGEGDLAGQLNPSYPLNYMEKPLTRIMLGRSFWDYDIKVDTSAYPTRPTVTATNAVVDIETKGKAVSYTAGNMQSTGLWAKQLEDVTVTGGVNATITVMLADDLTGRAQHETALKRPPRMQMTFLHNGDITTFKVPYGGLIYIQPNEPLKAGKAQFSFSNVVKAAFYKDGAWVTSPEESGAGIAEVDTGHFVYTTPVRNLESLDIAKFSSEMNRFANAASDFYGRDEVTVDGKHRKFTYDDLKGFRHRYVNDIQISIGAAHSGYPVMAASWSPQSTTVPTTPKDDWLLWHEVGHNLAHAPFTVPGAGEVANNLLALYMQELEGRNDNPQMDRLVGKIGKAPTWLAISGGHAWSQGDAGDRLIMFGQLKLWAETHFELDDWYAEGDVKPNVYNEDQGWNMFKLMHRKARGDSQGDVTANYCDASVTGLEAADHLMVCASYVSGFDLSEFFTKWNPGETSSTSLDGTTSYQGGITSKGLNAVSALGLDKPEVCPSTISSL